MKELFYPRSVIVLGVSEKTFNLGQLFMSNLRDFGYQGPVYPVGQKGGMFGDQPIYTSVLDVPRPVDLAAILVPAAVVPTMLEQCGQVGAKWAVIMSSGFSEYSDEKSNLENALLDIAKRYGMRLIGPNCVGILNTYNRLAGFFAPMPVRDVVPGPVSIMAQSGSVAIESAYLLSHHKVGTSKFVSLGNKLDTDEAELLKYLVEDDPDTKQISMYLEGIIDGRGLYEQAKKSTKPIVLYKANIVPGGSVAARSHTAALASDDAVVDAACKQANIVRARGQEQLLDYAKVLSLPPMKGNNVGVVVVSGGAGVVTSDYCYLHGFNLPEIPESLLQDIENKARTRAIRRGNPMDLGDTFDRDIVLNSAESFLRLPNVDALLLCLPGNRMIPVSGPPLEGVAAQIWELSQQLQKPVLISFSPVVHSVEQARAEMPFPVFTRPEQAVEALAVSRDYWKRRARRDQSTPTLVVDRARVKEIIQRAVAAGRVELNDEAMDILTAYGLAVESSRKAASPEEAVAIAREIGYPVVMKIWSPDISHKSDVGGVALNIKGDRSVASTFRRITRSVVSHHPEARVLGVTLQRMIKDGQEVIIGSKWDEQFGPVMMFGLGGVLVELFKDVSFRLAPLTRQDALEMIDEVRASKLLRGFRGQEASDVDAVVDALLRVSQLVTDFPEISEVDVNPLKVFGQGAGCRAVDSRLFLKHTTPVGEPGAPELRGGIGMGLAAPSRSTQ